MTRVQLMALALAACLAPSADASNVRWSIGLNFGSPPVVVHPRPWHYHVYPVYPAYRPTYVRSVIYEAPVVVRPAPIVYEPAPIVVPSPPPAPTRTTSSAIMPAAAESRSASLESHVALLRNPDEKVRADACLDLGRMKSERAVDSLAAALAGDRSASVRDAAARALALVGSPRALTALIHAAAADPDRDVRRSAQFAIEVIQSR